MGIGKSGKWWVRTAGCVVATVVSVRMLLVTTCVIPSSGMENSLYKGERILVSRWSYGLRVPFPSVFGYHRIAPSVMGKGDIVLFNNPHPQNPETRIERRELFISRCVGSPGDTLMLDDDLTEVGGEVLSPDSKALYVYPASMEDSMLALLDSLGLAGNMLAGYTSEGNYIRSFSHYEYYLVSQRLEGRFSVLPMVGEGWRSAHPFVVPEKGKPVKIYPWNMTLLCNTIVAHEHRRAEVKEGLLYVDGRPADSFTFTKDYYWVASNDPVNVCDSRLFGFVPEDHLIGKAWLIWYSPHEGRFFRRIE